MNAEQLLSGINRFISIYKIMIKNDTAVNKYNINNRAEVFFIPFLKKLYECENLKSANIEKQEDGIDLEDKEKRITFQVTSTKGSKKVEKTLESFLKKKRHEDFDTLYLFILGDKQKSYKSKNKINLENSIKELNSKFIIKIIDLSDVYKKISDHETKDIKIFYDLLSYEIDGIQDYGISIHPLNNRGDLNIPLFGREEEFNYLINKEEDILLIGNPGTGKTFLLSKLKEDKAAYFVEDKVKIESGLKLFNPEIVIFDNAHSNPDFLSKLINIRDDNQLTYKIIASSWKTDLLDKVRINGHFNDSNELNLKLLIKNNLYEIIKIINEKNKLIFKDWLSQRIIDESRGLPGLTVLFSETICKSKETNQFFTGDTIFSYFSSKLNEKYSPIEWQKIIKILSYFSLGGNEGISINFVSKETSFDRNYIQSVLIALDFGGIIDPKSIDMFSVHPPIFRKKLIEMTFFSNYSDDLNLVLQNLRTSGKSLPQLLIRDCLEIIYRIAPDEDNLFTQLFTKEERFDPEIIDLYLMSYPSKINEYLIYEFKDILNCQNSLFKHKPEIILKELIFNIQKTDKNDNNFQDIIDWINNPLDEPAEIIRKKKLLLKVIIENEESLEIQKMILLLKEVLTLEYDIFDPVPGDGSSFHTGRGFYNIEVYNKIYNLWSEIFLIIKKVPIEYHKDLNFIDLYSVQQIKDNQQSTESFLDLNEKIAIDLCSLCKNHPKLQFYYNQYHKKGIELVDDLKFDKRYIKIFDYDLISEEELNEISKEILQLPIKDAITLIETLNKENNLIQNYKGGFLKLREKLLDNNFELAKWANEFFQIEDYENSFYYMREAINKNDENFLNFIADFLSHEFLYKNLFEPVLFSKLSSEEILLLFLDKILSNKDFNLFAHLYDLNKAPETNISIVISRLYELSDYKDIFELMVKITTPPNNVFDKWKEIITSGYEPKMKGELCKIFDIYPELFINWIKNNIKNKQIFYSKGYEKYLTSLSFDEKIELLDILYNQNFIAYRIRMIKIIIGWNEEIYKNVIESSKKIKNKKFYMFPFIHINKNEINQWINLCIIALENGISKYDFINLSYDIDDDSMVMAGPNYQIIDEFFVQVNTNKNIYIKEISSEILKINKRRWDDFKEKEFERKIFGY